MIEKSEWIPLDFEIDFLKQKINLNGRSLDVGVSPYDIPQAFRLTIDQDRLRLTIEFKYISDEDETNVCYLPNDIVINLGKFSNRLHRVDFTVGKDVSELPSRLIEIGRVIGEYASLVKHANTRMVERAITMHAPEIELAF